MSRQLNVILQLKISVKSASTLLSRKPVSVLFYKKPTLHFLIVLFKHVVLFVTVFLFSKEQKNVQMFYGGN